jgi:hypothetical protein
MGKDYDGRHDVEPLESWRGRDDCAIWVDSDGDVLVADAKDYSIALSPEGAATMLRWLLLWWEKSRARDGLALRDVSGRLADVKLPGTGSWSPASTPP